MFKKTKKTQETIVLAAGSVHGHAGLESWHSTSAPRLVVDQVELYNGPSAQGLDSRKKPLTVSASSKLLPPGERSLGWLVSSDCIDHWRAKFIAPPDLGIEVGTKLAFFLVAPSAPKFSGEMFRREIVSAHAQKSCCDGSVWVMYSTIADDEHLGISFSLPKTAMKLGSPRELALEHPTIGQTVCVRLAP